MSLVTLEGIKAAVPTLLPKIGLFLGRAVTVITANPTTVVVLTIAIPIFILFSIWFVRASISGNERRIQDHNDMRGQIRDLNASFTEIRGRLG